MTSLPYFNIELKKTKLTSHTDTKLMDMSDRYWLRVLLPKRQQIFPLWTSTFSKRQLTVGRKWRHGAHERLDIVLLEFFPPISAHGLISLWHFRCLRMGKIDVITYKDVINEKWHVMITIIVLFYNYIHAYMYLILAKMTEQFGTYQLFPLLKYMINIS
jgi:hypothetical protein